MMIITQSNYWIKCENLFRNTSVFWMITIWPVKNIWKFTIHNICASIKTRVKVSALKWNGIRIASKEVIGYLKKLILNLVINNFTI